MAYVKPTPKLRNEAEVEIKSSIYNTINRHLNNSLMYPFKNCLNCSHWNYGKDICGKYNARPPTDIIVYSCPEHDDNQDIPF